MAKQRSSSRKKSRSSSSDSASTKVKCVAGVFLVLHSGFLVLHIALAGVKFIDEEHVNAVALKGWLLLIDILTTIAFLGIVICLIAEEELQKTIERGFLLNCVIIAIWFFHLIIYFSLWFFEVNRGLMIQKILFGLYHAGCALNMFNIIFDIYNC